MLLVVLYRFRLLFFGLSIFLVTFLFLNRMDPMDSLVKVNYKVFGRVQGVWFRKYTKQKADELNLSGWVQNDPIGTVSGVIEGSLEKVKEMKHWLSSVGSPHSKIDRAEFTDEQSIDRSSQAIKFKIKS